MNRAGDPSRKGITLAVSQCASLNTPASAADGPSVTNRAYSPPPCHPSRLSPTHTVPFPASTRVDAACRSALRAATTSAVARATPASSQRASIVVLSSISAHSTGDLPRWPPVDVLGRVDAGGECHGAVIGIPLVDLISHVLRQIGCCCPIRPESVHDRVAATPQDGHLRQVRVREIARARRSGQHQRLGRPDVREVLDRTGSGVGQDDPATAPQDRLHQAAVVRGVDHGTRLAGGRSGRLRTRRRGRVRRTSDAHRRGCCVLSPATRPPRRQPRALRPGHLKGGPLEEHAHDALSSPMTTRGEGPTLWGWGPLPLDSVGNQMPGWSHVP